MFPTCSKAISLYSPSALKHIQCPPLMDSHARLRWSRSRNRSGLFGHGKKIGRGIWNSPVGKKGGLTNHSVGDAESSSLGEIFPIRVFFLFFPTPKSTAPMMRIFGGCLNLERLRRGLERFAGC